MKRVLIIAFDFPPQGGTGSIRVTKLVKYLPQFGWQPVVVCSDALWNLDDSLARDIPPDVIVRRVGWPRLVRTIRPRPSAQNMTASTSASTGLPGAVSPRRMVAQIVRHFLVPDVNVLWTGAARRACAEVLREHPCDAVLTTSPPHSIHLVGAWVHTKFKLPWLADFRDVWTAENPALRRSGRLNFMLQHRLERRMLNACDQAVMITGPLGQRVLDTFGSQLGAKFRTITNGFDPEDFAGPPPKVDDVFTIAYIGTILGPQVDNALPDGLRLAVEQNERFRHEARIHFVGRLDAAYRARFAGLESHIEMSDFVAHSTGIDRMRRAQVLLIVLPNTDLARMTFTNKFFEYLAARRPILAVVPPGLISDIVTRENIGVVAAPDDPTAIAQALLTMFDSVRAQPDDYHVSNALLAQFDRRELTRQFAACLDENTK